MPKGTLMTTAVCVREEQSLQVHETTTLKTQFQRQDQTSLRSSHQAVGSFDTHLTPE